VLELYGLTPAVRTQHLEAFLEQHCAGHVVPPTLRSGLPEGTGPDLVLLGC
jgi:hypothetical protein